MPVTSKSILISECNRCPYRQGRLFCNFSSGPLEEFNRIGRLTQVYKGSLLFREGFVADRIFVLCTGKVKLSCGSQGGKLFNVKIASPGDVLGLGAVASGTPFEVTAEAMESCVVKVISQGEFLAFLDHHGEAARHAARALALEYNAALANARSLALSASISGRLARLLLDWRGHDLAMQPEMPYTMDMTHDDLAAFTASTRETVTRTLGQFQKEKLISIEGVSMKILEPQRLEALTL